MTRADAPNVASPTSRSPSTPDRTGPPNREDAAEPSNEEIHDVLSNARRRYVLEYLAREECPVSVSDLVDYVARREYGDDSSDVAYQERKRVYNALRQSHLPKLDSLDVVEYRPREGKVHPAENVQRVQAYLAFTPEEDTIPWSTYYLGATVFSVALGVLVWADVPPLVRLGWPTVAVAVVALFGSIAIAHNVRVGRNHDVGTDPGGRRER